MTMNLYTHMLKEKKEETASVVGEDYLYELQNNGIYIVF